MEAYTLFELNEHVRRVVALNFQDPVWVRCEIAQVKQSRAHFYLELVEKTPDHSEVIAQISAVIWGKTAWLIQKKLKDVFQQLLQDGMEICLKVRVEFHERYGMKLVIDDIDPSYTLGNLELKRRQILTALEAEGLLRRNAQLTLPSVVQRIAILSTERAAGFQDFRHHLLTNSYNFRYVLDLYPVSVQGARAEHEIVEAFERIGFAKKHYDCVVIIRGGGSRLDLVAFDSLAIGSAVAKCPLPVLTGIGHEIDTTVTDITAHTALKTPTAVADFLTQINLRFASNMEQTFAEIGRHVQRAILNHKTELRHVTDLIHRAPREFLSRKHFQLEQLLPSFRHLGLQTIRRKEEALQHADVLVSSLDPVSVLSRGFSITVQKGKRLRSSKEVTPEEELTTYFADGNIQSRVIRHE